MSETIRRWVRDDGIEMTRGDSEEGITLIAKRGDHSFGQTLPAAMLVVVRDREWAVAAAEQSLVAMLTENTR